jgi:hypothetical protein
MSLSFSGVCRREKCLYSKYSLAVICTHAQD